MSEDATLVSAIIEVEYRAEAQSMAEKLVDFKLMCCLVIWYIVGDKSYYNL